MNDSNRYDENRTAEMVLRARKISSQDIATNRIYRLNVDGAVESVRVISSYLSTEDETIDYLVRNLSTGLTRQMSFEEFAEALHSIL